MAKEKPLSPWREKVFVIIFEADTYWGKVFDVSLLVFIIASVLSVMLETVAPIEAKYGHILGIFEIIFTVYFTVEYILRLICVRRPWKYATSFFGIIDLLAILPKYLSLFFAGTHYLAVIRALRILRVFRIFKLAHFMNESTVILRALKASRAKITVFLVFILLVVMILGSVMYLIEGGETDTGFTSIPRSVYWAVVTLTTVGYGDIAPGTPFGQFIAAIIMIMGYAVIAVPTGIVTAEFANMKDENEVTTITCNSCANEGHDSDAEFCKYCGTKLNELEDS